MRPLALEQGQRPNNSHNPVHLQSDTQASKQKLFKIKRKTNRSNMLLNGGIRTHTVLQQLQQLSKAIRLRLPIFHSCYAISEIEMSAALNGNVSARPGASPKKLPW